MLKTTLTFTLNDQNNTTLYGLRDIREMGSDWTALIIKFKGQDKKEKYKYSSKAEFPKKIIKKKIAADKNKIEAILDKNN